jgi:hypothetical protein
VNSTVALIAVGAVMFMTGLMTALVAEAIRLLSRHAGSAMTGVPTAVGAGEIVAASGLTLGLTALVLLLPGRSAAGRTGQSRSGALQPDWQQDSDEDWLRPLRPQHGAVVGQQLVGSQLVGSQLAGQQLVGSQAVGQQPDDQPGNRTAPLVPLPQASGEGPLVRSLAELSRRQRELIKEYFVPSGVRQADHIPSFAGDDGPDRARQPDMGRQSAAPHEFS